MPDLSAVLPPIGQIIGVPGESEKAVSFLSRLAYESRQASETAEAEAVENLEIYTYGKSPKPSDNEVISNHIRDAVDAVVDAQTKEAPQVQLVPVETGDEGDIYRTDIPTSAPIPPDVAQAMAQTQVVGVDPATGQPIQQPGADPGLFVQITDKTVSDFYQQQLDVYWSRGRFDQAFRRITLKNNIYGYMLPVFEWRSDVKKPKLHDNISLLQTYADSTVVSIEEAQFAGVDWWLDAGQAKAMFPKLAAQIDEWSSTGYPKRPDTSTILGFNVDRYFQRNNVILRVFWLRDQPCPMQPEQAVASGQVEQRAVLDAQTNPNSGGSDSDEAGNMAGMPDDGAASGQVASDMGQMVGSEGTPAEYQPGDVGNGSTAAPAPAPTRVGFFFPGDDEEIDPDHPAWPTRTCIRQLTQVGNEIVEDIECPYWDMPVVHTVAGFIPNTLYGQGLPQRLKSMQYGRNRALSNMVEHTDLFAHPIEIYPQSTWDQLPAKYKVQGARKSGMQCVVPDQIYQQAGGKIMVSQPPEPIPVSLVQLQELLKGELSDRSSNPEVLQGKPPGNVHGWQAIQLLSQNAQSRFGFAVQWSADMVWRVAKLLLHALVDNLEVSDLMQVSRQYPAHIVAAIKQRASQIDWDIDVTINIGTGVIRARKKQEAVEAFNIRDPLTGEPAISMETLRDRLGEDNEQEAQRNARAIQQSPQFQQQQMMMAQQQQQQAQQQPGSANPARSPETPPI
jgi:hypothetical protein